MPFGDSVARLPQGWFLNTSVLWLTAVVLVALVRGPLRNAPELVRKPLKFVAASCIALGALILLMWNPVVQTAKQNKPVGRSGFGAGLTSSGWIVSFFRIFMGRPTRRYARVPIAIGNPAKRSVPNPILAARNVPSERFADVSAVDDATAQIRQIVHGRLASREVPALWPVSERHSLVRPALHG